MTTNYNPYKNTEETDFSAVDTLIIDSADPYSVLYTDENQEVKSLNLAPGQVITGQLGSIPTAKVLQGTANQVIVNDFKLSTPQDIDAKSSPTFNNLTATGLVNGRDIATDGKTLDSLASSTGSYVSIGTVQTITAAKMFDYPIHFTIPSTSRKKIDLYASSTAGSEHAFYGMALDGNTTVIQCPSASQNIAFKVGAVTESKEIFEVRGDRGAIRPGIDAPTLSLGSSSRKFYNLYLANNADIAETITSGLVNGRDIAADGKTLDGLAAATGSYVTTNTTQTITGKKTFQNTELDYVTETKNIFRMRSTAPTGEGGTTIHMVGNNHFGNGLIISNDGSDIASFMNANDFEFYGASDSKRIVTFKSNQTSIHPGAAVTTDLGTALFPFKNLYLGTGAGIARLGHGIRTADRAELHLNSNGDLPADICFGINGYDESNIKWMQSVRTTESKKSDMVYYRGAHNTSGAPAAFLTFKGDGTAILPGGSVSLGSSTQEFSNLWCNYVRAESIIFDDILGVNNMSLSGHARNSITLNYNGNHGDNWWEGIGVQVIIVAYYVITGTRISLTFPPIDGNVRAVVIGSNWFNFTTNLPAALCPIRNQNKVIAVQGNGAWGAGNVSVTTAGKIDIYNGFSTGGWSASESAGFKGFTISWCK